MIRAIAHVAMLALVSAGFVAFMLWDSRVAAERAALEQAIERQVR